MKNYSEKEKLIFAGVLKLLSDRRGIYNITVQDIAVAAGVGKGTIYDYFKSKDEIIVKTILYCNNEENQKLNAAIDRENTFKDKMYAVYDSIFANAGNPLSPFTLLITNGAIAQITDFLLNDCSEYTQINQQIEKTFEKVLLFAALNGEIAPPTSRDYLKLAVSSNIIGVGKTALENAYNNDSYNFEALKENAFKMLVKSLN